MDSSAASVDSKRLINGSFQANVNREDPSEVSVIVEDKYASLDESEKFHDARATQSDDGDGIIRQPSDVGSIPLKNYSLEIINGLAPGEPIPGVEAYDNNKSGSNRYSPVASNQEDSDDETIDFLQDNPKDMTKGRRIALWMMKKYKWYNPLLSEDQDKHHETDVIIDGGKYRTQDGYPILHSKEEKPSLEKAWAYWDHVALPRYMYVPKENNEKKGVCTRIIRKWSKANKQLNRAEPGEDEKPTRLYSPWFTPHKQLGDFGLGIGLYFSTIRALTLLTLVAGIIHIPNFIYFSSEEYSNGQTEVDALSRGSAICTNISWVPCPTCDTSKKSDSFLQNPVNNATFARKNNCDGATMETGMVNFICLIFVIVAAFGLNRYLAIMEVQFDEDEQTAQDYSIVINNPPSDATDPEEWREYFKNAFGAHVTGCTVAVDNDDLVRTLVERREKMRMLELAVEPGTKLDIVTLAGIAAAEEIKRSALQSFIALFAGGIPETFGRLAVLTAKVQGLAQQDYPVTNVFITFETEADQRNVLSKLTVGQLAADSNRKSAVGDSNYLFRGFRVLAVAEPEEPDSIRWDDLNVGLFDRLKQQFFTALATVAALVVVALVVFLVNKASPVLTAYTIAIANAIFPMFAKILSYNEAHPDHGSLQTSLYYKIAVFRWVTTAIIITIITPFEHVLSNEKGGLISQVEAQFFAEITTTSAIQLADPIGHIQRHFLAPRAQTQDAMNLLMQGTTFELAERYTAAAKLLFLAFWYCSVYPGTFFWCALSMQVIYYLDKFCLTRTWKRAPRLGATISQFNRSVFFPLSIVAMAIFSSYYWSGFPFDNLCVDENSDVTVIENSSYVGDFSIPVDAKEDIVSFLTKNKTSEIDHFVNFTIAVDSMVYKSCYQNLLNPFRFPFVSFWQEPDAPYGGDYWMTEEQETVTDIYGYTALGILCAFIIMVILRIVLWFLSYFHGGSYDPTGEDQGQNFSEIDAACLYVPQVESSVFSYPLLACTVDNIDEEMLDWTDPEHPHAFYDLTKDANALIRGIDMSGKVVFSQVAHWPPEEKKNV